MPEVHVPLSVLDLGLGQSMQVYRKVLWTSGATLRSEKGTGAQPSSAEVEPNVSTGTVVQGHPFGTEFWEGDATKQKSLKSGAFLLNQGKAFSK